MRKNSNTNLYFNFIFLLQYKWLCKTTNGDDCLMAGNHPELREAIDDKLSSTSSELVIRELTLQPGR